MSHVQGHVTGSDVTGLSEEVFDESWCLAPLANIGQIHASAPGVSQPRERWTVLKAVVPATAGLGAARLASRDGMC